MAWEDDRGHLLQEISRCHAVSRREKSTQKHLKRQISNLAAKMEQHFPTQVVQEREEEEDNKEKFRSSEDKDNSLGMFDSETQPHCFAKKGKGVECVQPQAKKLKACHDDKSMISVSATGCASNGTEVQGMDSPSKDCRFRKIPARNTSIAGNVVSTKVELPVPRESSARPGRYTCGHGVPETEMRYSETARGKNAQETLRGYACAECEGYYRALEQQGVHVSRDATMPKRTSSLRGRNAEGNDSKSRTCRADSRRNTIGGLESVYGQAVSDSDGESRDLVQLHSRHRNKSTPPSTPEGFWDLTVHTPEEWKQEKKKRI